MFKSKKYLVGMLMGIFLVLSVATPIFAQDEVTPVDPPEVEEEPSNFLNHPIVNLIVEFFKDVLSPPEPDIVPPEVDQETNDPPVGEVISLEEPEEVTTPEEAVVAMHTEDNLGFGEITKLMGLLESICSESEGPCEVTYDDLLSEYKDGDGMGALFKRYGKPDYMGVGHIRKELNPKEKSNNGKAKGKNK
jgi:hypothetical protein